MNDGSDSLHEMEWQLLSLVPATPESLYVPIGDVLRAGGKRARPMLTLLTSDIASANSKSREVTNATLNAACAVELLHTFTLVHDDIMDNASTRRGLPTLHTTYGVSTAILAGDGLMALANQALAMIQSPLLGRIVTEFALGFRAVCEGQALDEEFEGRKTIAISEYIDMIDLKTSKVFELAAVLGALAGGGQYVEEVRGFAHHLGLAFQIMDDLLDLTANERTFGKTPGGDILEGKRTFLFAAAMEQYSSLAGEDLALLEKVRDRRATPRDIPLMQGLLERLGVLERARAAALGETQKAEASLNAIPESEARERLHAFGRSFLGRDH
ncbi:MAG: polyprenyl synthetase family protein [Bacteroidota bacterium]|nr:polyprenyl synthetase family protein [Bacteroidota bacterium]MDP4232592.1 polyprenyl synthetase family protein [Bacteroidota bacterium]MDP4242954.1 polyprenyl synthetase family protein [Bacteroidota bacterium]MDP4286471.1 polyprenyl synthetase family protein [Bacteroidota bacterium]